MHYCDIYTAENYKLCSFVILIRNVTATAANITLKGKMPKMGNPSISVTSFSRSQNSGPTGIWLSVDKYTFR